MDPNQEKTDEQKAATAKAAAETKTAAEKTAAEEKVATEQDVAAEKLGTDFDKKADEGEGNTAYTETDEEKEAKAEAEEAEKAEAKTKADAEASKEDPKEVDESLLERAVKVGLTLEKAKRCEKDVLEHTVELLEQSQSEKEKTPDEIEAEKKAKEEAEAKVKEDEAPYDCKLDPNGYDEDLIKAVNELGTMLKKRVVALEAGHTKHAASIFSDRITKHTDWLDSKINRRATGDEELKKVYGIGDIDDLEEGGEQFKARAALDTKITKIASGLRKAKKTVPSRNKLFDMAIEVLHKGKKTKADAKTKAKLEARAKEALGGGSSKVSAETAEAKALQIQKDFDKKQDED